MNKRLKQKHSLSLFMFLVPLCAFAHGEEVLLPILGQLVSILVFLILMALSKLKFRDKIILATLYLLTLCSIGYFSRNVPYIDNRAWIDLSSTFGPALTTLMGFFIIKRRNRANESTK